MAAQLDDLTLCIYYEGRDPWKARFLETMVRTIEPEATLKIVHHFLTRHDAPELLVAYPGLVRVLQSYSVEAELPQLLRAYRQMR